ncbi:olfactory receptor 10A7-like [Spea bombifrons]|uniref:olfactory receptor 10A7-like n=1 Tax=Spea bombifrons TaxID=233779 RepID=UPI00234BE950|nr:olfactory receptor 10A7-like [Spea bombifrons]
MTGVNHTQVTEFLLLGFKNIYVLNLVTFIIFLLIYFLTLAGNLLIIIMVSKVQSLKAPMYFFLSHLSLSDILLTSAITPNMLHVVLHGGATISVKGCITQLIFYSGNSAAECLLLTVMSYDRYLAICNPLHYNSIMDLSLRLHLVLWSWVIAFMVALLLSIFLWQLQFYGAQTMDHYFCDLAPLLELTCSDHSTVQLVSFVLTIPLLILPFFFILFTYISIFLSVLKINSASGKKKAISTCSSHLIVVSTYYGTLMNIYMVPSKGHAFNVNKLVSLLYTALTPLSNPIIYSLRNQEIMGVLKKFLSMLR